MFKKIGKKIVGFSNFFKSDIRIGLLVVFILEFIINICIVGFTRYDGEYFINKSQEMSLWDFTVMRYYTWSSRNIIEFLSCIILRWPTTLWALVNSIFMTLIAYLLILICSNTKNKKIVYMSIVFMFIYPVYEISSVGWGVGALNYTWVLLALLISCYYIKKVMNNEKINWYMYLLFILSQIYACNQEQACIVLFLVFLIFTGIQIFSKKYKLKKFMILQLIIAIISLTFILTCPGNQVRTDDEIISYYMDYNSLSICDKFSLGVVSTVKGLILEKNLVFLSFAIMMSTYIIKKYKNYLYRVVSLIPLVSIVVLGYGRNIIVSSFPYLSIYLDSFENTNLYIFTNSYLDIINYIPIIFSLIIIGSIILSLILVTNKLKDNLVLLIFILGLITRVIMGFSPTVFASSERTFLFFDFALIMINIMIWEKYINEFEKQSMKNISKFEFFYPTLAVFQYINTLLFVLISI